MRPLPVLTAACALLLAPVVYADIAPLPVDMAARPTPNEGSGPAAARPLPPLRPESGSPADTATIRWWADEVIAFEQPNNAVVTTALVPSVDGEITLVTVRPWDAEHADVIDGSFLTFTIYSQGFTLPDGSSAGTGAVVDYTVAQLLAALGPAAPSSSTADVVPLGAAQMRTPVQRFEVLAAGDAAEVIVGAVEREQAIVVFTLYRSDRDSAFFEPLRNALQTFALSGAQPSTP